MADSLPAESRPAQTLLKSTTRHVRLFTARVEDGNLLPDPSQLTMDVDPDNEFLWDAPVLAKVQDHFRELVAAQAGADLTEYNLRQIGSQLEGLIRQLERELWRREMSLRGLRRSGACGHESDGSGRSV
jgi:NAD(P)H-quinone oxidoreductase subunit M